MDIDLVVELYENYMGERQDFYAALEKILVGRECIINYWKNGKNHKRKATILAADHADHWGITLNVGIHRLDGKPGYLDDHNASWTRLSRVTFE